MANNTPVSQVDTHKCLVVQIDEKVTWDSHNDMICEIVPLNSLEKVYESLVKPYFDYCFPLWNNCGKLLMDKLQKGDRFVGKFWTIAISSSFSYRSS